MNARQEAGAPPPSVAAVVWRFAAAGLIALSSVGLASVVLSQSVGREVAVAEAGRIARLTGVGIVQPLVTQGLIAGDQDDLDRLNDVVVDAVLEGSLIRVKVWQPVGNQGRIVYSDEGRLLGEVYRLDEDERRTVVTGELTAGTADLSDPENRFEQLDIELLEVYVPIEGPNGLPLIYEAYFRLDGVRDAGQRIWLAFAPLGIGALLILQLVQLPLAWSLARRLRQESLQRERMLYRSIESSARERRRIAAELHDGVVQELAGVSYSLTAAAAAPRESGEAEVDPDEGVRATAAAAGRTLRGAIGSLRSLLVDIYPPDLDAEGLDSALEDLLARHRTAGLEVHLRTELNDDLAATVAALVYRIAQEALRNIAKHAGAHRVDVLLVTADGNLTLQIEDDGAGFDLADPEDTEGHLGLRLLADAAADLGGRLEIRSAPGSGTLLRLDLLGVG